MSPRAKRQLLHALHPHYRSAPKPEKAQILDAFTMAAGYHRKHISAHLLAYRRAEHLTFTRAREYRKNDQARVEERDGAVLRLWVNFFQPSMRLIAEQRVGAKVHKRDDQARTRYQCVRDSTAVCRSSGHCVVGKV